MRCHFRVINSAFCVIFSLFKQVLKGGRSYFTIIKAGSFNFRVNLDTASADLWLVSTDCAAQACQNLPRYPLQHFSPTFTAVGDNSTVFKAQYADTTCTWPIDMVHMF